jgi:hypothetical protein
MVRIRVIIAEIRNTIPTANEYIFTFSSSSSLYSEISLVAPVCIHAPAKTAMKEKKVFNKPNIPNPRVPILTAKNLFLTKATRTMLISEKEILRLFFKKSFTSQPFFPIMNIPRAESIAWSERDSHRESF